VLISTPHTETDTTPALSLHAALPISHHYAGRIRPADHYSMGWLPVWARLAAFAPGLVNAVTHTPGLDRLIKRLGNIEPTRPVPRSEEHTSELQSRENLVCRLLLEKTK